MDTNAILLCIIIIAAIICFCVSKTSEGYSPFRHTGGCPPRTGYNYLDAYEQQDYYMKYPYIYPTPVSYTTAWYAGRRAEDRSYEQARLDQMTKNV